MRYVISDIHGCYGEYINLLNKINLQDEDTLYILGDIVDRGPNPIKVFQDIMSRDNVKFIIGNHEVLFQFMARKFIDDVKDDSYKPKRYDIEFYIAWLESGGRSTNSEFKKLNKIQKEEILHYIENASLYEKVKCNGNIYILTHAGIKNFDESKNLDEYDVLDFVEYRTDYSRRYFKDENTFLITGHTPTMVINENGQPDVFIKNGHIAIDCGCAYGGRLASYCIETGEVLYSD